MRDSQDHSLLSQDGQNFAAAADSKVSRILNVDLMIGNLSRPPKSIELYTSVWILGNSKRSRGIHFIIRVQEPLILSRSRPRAVQEPSKSRPRAVQEPSKSRPRAVQEPSCPRAV